MSSEKQYFDRLEIKFVKKRGYELYAIDDIENRHEFVDFQKVAPFITDSNEIELRDGNFPLTLRKRFKNREDALEEETLICKIIKEIEFKELHVNSPNSRIHRN